MRGQNAEHFRDRIPLMQIRFKFKPSLRFVFLKRRVQTYKLECICLIEDSRSYSFSIPKIYYNNSTFIVTHSFRLIF